MANINDKKHINFIDQKISEACSVLAARNPNTSLSFDAASLSKARYLVFHSLISNQSMTESILRLLLADYFVAMQADGHPDLTISQKITENVQQQAAIELLSEMNNILLDFRYGTIEGELGINLLQDKGRYIFSADTIKKQVLARILTQAAHKIEYSPENSWFVDTLQKFATKPQVLEIIGWMLVIANFDHNKNEPPNRGTGSDVTMMDTSMDDAILPIEQHILDDVISPQPDELLLTLHPFLLAEISQKFRFFLDVYINRLLVHVQHLAENPTHCNIKGFLCNTVNIKRYFKYLTTNNQMKEEVINKIQLFLKNTKNPFFKRFFNTIMEQ